MIAVCPQDPRHDRFVTVAHVAQDWVVTAQGDFIEEVQTTETTHPPDPGNIWTCHVCGAEAQIYPADAVGLRVLQAAIVELDEQNELTRQAETPIEVSERSRPSELAERQR